MNTIDAPLTVLVGPNSAGKTNVFRLIVLLRDVFGEKREGTEQLSWKTLLKQYTKTYESPACIRLGLRFSSDEERMLLRYFWVSALMRPDDSVFGPISSHADAWDRVIDKMFQDFSGDNLIAPMLQGHLELEYNRHSDRHRLFFTFSVGDQTVYWMLDPSDGGLTTRLPHPDLSSWSIPSLVSVWSRTWTSEFRKRMQEVFADNGPKEIPDMEWDWTAIIRWLHEQSSSTFAVIQAQPIARNRIPSVLQPFWNKLRLADHGQVWSVRDLWIRLFTEQVVVSQNPRGLPEGLYSPETWTPTQFSAERLDAYLFRLKVGSVDDRRRFHTVQKLVERLSDDVTIDVEATVDLGSDARLPHVDLDMRLQNRGESHDYPLSTGGAGIGELVYLSALLNRPAMGVVLLDEPGANLHAYALRRLEEFLAEYIASDQGPQVILITHTPYLVPSGRIEMIRRLYRGTAGTSVSVAMVPEMTENSKHVNKHQDFWSRSPNIANLLFYNAVLLVDGPTEVAALTVWYQKEKGELLERQNLAIFSVDGKTSLPFYWRELDALHVPWVCLVDGDSLKPKSEDGSNVWMALCKASIVDRDTALEKKSLPFDQQVAALRNYKIYVRGTSDTDTFETLKEIQDIPVPATHSGKVRRGYWIAGKIECPREFNPVFGALQQAGIGNEPMVSSTIQTNREVND